MPFVDARISIVLTLLLLLLLAFVVYRRKIGQELVVAALFALFITSYVDYVYEGFNITLGTINVFPLVAWTAGLVVLREIYEHVHIKFRWGVVSVLYVVLLFALEYIGYSLLGIQIAAEHPDLLGTGLIHGPPIIHLYYVSAGPLFLLITDYLKVE